MRFNPDCILLFLSKINAANAGDNSDHVSFDAPTRRLDLADLPPTPEVAAVCPSLRRLSLPLRFGARLLKQVNQCIEARLLRLLYHVAELSGHDPRCNRLSIGFDIGLSSAARDGAFKNVGSTHRMAPPNAVVEWRGK
ncbi:hypothetical protein [Lichenifustis flavocetrariae]|uniref:Uncharacterized protein n=1 Tax=Lichenifustis flavocetrariae TaxID=2949735 RepID=A0AA42CMZ6_9HYPH|nr:hypothetical protein [Lichenifustis flavocetrariae]MCW6508897.1 hypothetical protein [Lichenifustis flavocetrariae]